MEKKVKDLEKLLIEEGIVFDDELEGALGAKGVNREELAKFLAAAITPTTIDLTKVTCDSTAAFLVPEETARKLVAMPLLKKNDVIVIAVSKVDPDIVHQLRETTGRKVKVVLAREQEIFEMIDAFYTRGEVTIKAEGKPVGEIDYNAAGSDPFPLVSNPVQEEPLTAIPVELDESLAVRAKFCKAIQEWETRFLRCVPIDPIKLE